MYVSGCYGGESHSTASASGLGLPIIPVAIGIASAIGGLFRRKPKVTEADARKAVQQIYLEVLEREPDAGAQGYIDCLYKGAQHDPDRGWCDVDFIRTELLRSQEYKDLQMKKAAAVYAPGSTSAGLPFSGAGDVVSGGIGGIPFTWIAVGLGLVLLMKR